MFGTSKFTKRTYDKVGPAVAEVGGPGFVVTIEGYSPYGDIYISTKPFTQPTQEQGEK